MVFERPSLGGTRKNFVSRGLAEGCFDGRAGLAPNHVQANKQPTLQPISAVAQLVLANKRTH
jgi:hypothetical protein